MGDVQYIISDLLPAISSIVAVDAMTSLLRKQSISTHLAPLLREWRSLPTELSTFTRTIMDICAVTPSVPIYDAAGPGEPREAGKSESRANASEAAKDQRAKRLRMVRH